MREEPLYNPLDKKNLGVSVADAMLERATVPMPLENPFIGAGIYAIYYIGDFPLYKPIADLNCDGRFNWPIYVGKAVPPGAKKVDLDWERIQERHSSVDSGNIRIQ